MDMDRWYKRTPGTRMVGVKVRALVPLQNRVMEVPRGTVLTIASKRGGLELRGDPCGKCGVSVSISDVPPTWVELVNE